MKRGKRYNIVKRNVAVGLLLGMLNSMLFADIKVDKNVPQKTSVDRAQNGANIININTPNNKGISVNDFSEFRTKDPTVFNNFGQGVGRSYLAGMMAANPNLTKEQAARLILNRVGGNNRVEIENWLEVMSENKTDIIFSSQNGFYLNNTGFINFDKAIFTTSRVDLDGNGEFSTGDRTFIGDPNPDFTFGFTNNFTLKNWYLDVLVTGSVGNDIYNASRFETELMNDFKNQSTEVLNRWTTAGQITNVPRANSSTALVISDRFIEDGSFVKLKSVTLGYNFKNPFKGMNKLNVYVTGQNLYTITDYKGFDPEVNAFSTTNGVLGIDYGTYPQVRTIIVGLKANF